MASGAIQSYEGDPSDPVELDTNVPGQLTPVMQVSPDRGNGLRIVNGVQKGDDVGVPIYADLVDVNGDPLPTTTVLQWEYSPSNTERRYAISRKLNNISQYNRYAIEEQSDADRIDSFKHVFTQPEFAGSDAVQHFAWNYNEDIFLSVNTPVEVDMQASSIEVDPGAIEGPFTAEV